MPDPSWFDFFGVDVSGEPISVSSRPSPITKQNKHTEGWPPKIHGQINYSPYLSPSYTNRSKATAKKPGRT